MRSSLCSFAHNPPVAGSPSHSGIKPKSQQWIPRTNTIFPWTFTSYISDFICYSFPLCLLFSSYISFLGAPWTWQACSYHRAFALWSRLIFPYIFARFSPLLSSGPFKVYLSRKSSGATVPGSKLQEDQSSFATLWISSSGYWFLCFILLLFSC